MAEENQKDKPGKKEVVETPNPPDDSKEDKLELDLVKPDVFRNELQVAEMPESSELQKRRAQTKARLREFAEGVTEEESEAFDDGESSGLMDIIKEAGLSARHLKFCLGLLVFAGIVVSGFFGAGKLWKYLKGIEIGGNDVEVEEEANTASSNQQFSSDIDAGINLGFEESYKDYATSSGESLGSSASSKDEFAQMVEDFGNLYNSLEVDVNDLLDQSNDRSFELHKYMNELEELLNKAELNSRKLERENEDLSDQFNEVDGDKTDYEDGFFQALTDLNGDGATENLENFIDSAKETTELRAEYRARAKLADYYEKGIEAATLRLKDLNYNKEALVKGIRIVDIAGSDLNLVIEESQL